MKEIHSSSLSKAFLPSCIVYSAVSIILSAVCAVLLLDLRNLSLVSCKTSFAAVLRSVWSNFLNKPLTLSALVFTKELTSKGEVSKKYLTLCDFINKTLPTMASAKEEEKPTVVSLWGNDDFTPNFSENIYKNKV